MALRGVARVQLIKSLLFECVSSAIRLRFIAPPAPRLPGCPAARPSRVLITLKLHINSFIRTHSPPCGVPTVGMQANKWEPSPRQCEIKIILLRATKKHKWGLN